MEPVGRECAVELRGVDDKIFVMVDEGRPVDAAAVLLAAAEDDRETRGRIRRATLPRLRARFMASRMASRAGSNLSRFSLTHFFVLAYSRLHLAVPHWGREEAGLTGFPTFRFPLVEGTIDHSWHRGARRSRPYTPAPRCRTVPAGRSTRRGAYAVAIRQVPQHGVYLRLEVPAGIDYAPQLLEGLLAFLRPQGAGPNSRSIRWVALTERSL